MRNVSVVLPPSTIVISSRSTIPFTDSPKLITQPLNLHIPVKWISLFLLSLADLRDEIFVEFLDDTIYFAHLPPLNSK